MHPLRLFLGLILLAWSVAVPAAALPGFEQLERTLHLNPMQKAQFDVAVAATQRALLAVALNGMQVKERLATELSKPKPDLAEILRAQEDLFEQTRPLFREAHGEWARLYAMLDAAQVSIAREYVEERLNRLEGLAGVLRDLLVEKRGN